MLAEKQAVVKCVSILMLLIKCLGKKRGFAFVQFETRELAMQAINKYNAHQLKGNPTLILG